MLLSSIGLRLRRYGLGRERWDAVATLSERSPLSGSAAYGGRLGLNLCVSCLAHARTTSEMRNRACRNYGHWRVISLSPERGSTVGHLAAANLPYDHAHTRSGRDLRQKPIYFDSHYRLLR